MIPRNTQYPTDRIFSTSCYLVQKMNGTFIDYANVDLYQSPTGSLQDAKCLAEFGFVGATPSPQAIRVEYSIDRNGFVTVTNIQTCDGRVLRRKERVVKLNTRERGEEEQVDNESDSSDSVGESDREPRFNLDAILPPPIFNLARGSDRPYQNLRVSWNYQNRNQKWRKF